MTILTLGVKHTRSKVRGIDGSAAEGTPVSTCFCFVLGFGTILIACFCVFVASLGNFGLFSGFGTLTMPKAPQPPDKCHKYGCIIG